MGWQQVRNFNINKMGKKKGWCLQNCRLGFGISSGKYASAIADKNAQAKAGTLHPIETLPSNVSVPIYTKGGGKYGHVLVSDRGTIYSDGAKSNLNIHGQVYGWGELCDGVRVVNYVNTTPAPAHSNNNFLPTRGYWRKGDCDPKIGRVASFMRLNFPAYTSPQALGNYYGNFIWSSIREFQRRTGLQPDGNIGSITYAKLKSYGFQG